MEKSITRLLILMFFIPIVAVAQKSIHVFKTEGLVFLESNKTDDRLTKGDYISKNAKIILLKDATLTAIDPRGKLYVLTDEGSYYYKDLIKAKRKKTSRFTKNFFKYIWNEMFASDVRTSFVAAVYRGDELMEFPRDSTLAEGHQINFEWSSMGQNANYYFILKNKQTKRYIKFSTNATRISLDKENPIFDLGCEFEWAVVLNYPSDLNKIYFYKFIDAHKLEKIKTKYQDYIAELKDIGVDEYQIFQRLSEMDKK